MFLMSSVCMRFDPSYIWPHNTGKVGRIFFTPNCHLAGTINNLKQRGQIVRASHQNVNKGGVCDCCTITKNGNTKDSCLKEYGPHHLIIISDVEPIKKCPTHLISVRREILCANILCFCYYLKKLGAPSKWKWQAVAVNKIGNRNVHALILRWGHWHLCHTTSFAAAVVEQTVLL